MDDATSRFELVTDLPHKAIQERTKRLIGFEPRFERIRKDLEMLLAPDKVRQWSKRQHGTVLPICDVLEDRYPLVVFHGDVGTGKTATAEGISDRLAREHDSEATLLKLSTRVRGKGLHGEMSKLIGEAFDEVVVRAGKGRMAFLVIDEADALASSRDGSQLHQEEKAGTNTLIQKIDGVRLQRGRILVFLCTNRLHALDPAILRRARLEEFARPTDAERRELFARDLEGVELSDREVATLVALTGPAGRRGVGMTFSDLRTRFLPAAVAEAFPDHKLTFEILERAARATPPSPSLQQPNGSRSDPAGTR
jgi:AAA+ superfamily predicted ATPase